MAETTSGPDPRERSRFSSPVSFCSSISRPGVPFFSAVWSSQKRFESFLQKEGRKTPTRADFVFLGIDQSTLQLPPFAPEELAGNRALQLMTERSFPWSREVWALLLDRLFAAGARVVIFDLVFSPPNEGDPAFRAALDRYRGRVVLGANFDVANAMQAIVPNERLDPAAPDAGSASRLRELFSRPDRSAGPRPSLHHDRPATGRAARRTRARKFFILSPRAAWNRSGAGPTSRGIIART